MNSRSMRSIPVCLTADVNTLVVTGSGEPIGRSRQLAASQNGTIESGQRAQRRAPLNLDRPRAGTIFRVTPLRVADSQDPSLAAGGALSLAVQHLGVVCARPEAVPPRVPHDTPA